jgi:hypothetical protein
MRTSSGRDIDTRRDRTSIGIACSVFPTEVEAGHAAAFSSMEFVSERKGFFLYNGYSDLS